MPLPTEQTEIRDKLNDKLNETKATLKSPLEGNLNFRTPIPFTCACGNEHTKSLSNLLHGPGGAICPKCAKAQGVEKRKYTLTDQKSNINNGETDFNRALAEKTASKDGSLLLGIYTRNNDGSYTLIVNDARITRDAYLHIRCPCGAEDYVNFRGAYGHGALSPGNGLCLCKACRKGHKSQALSNTRRGEDNTNDIPVESMAKRAERIEKKGQECSDCKELKPASEFFGRHNSLEKCKVYKRRCYACSRKLRTTNRESKLRNGSLEDFMKTEMEIANDRIKKYIRAHPDSKREFSLTLPFLVELYEKQDGKCALSGSLMRTNDNRDTCPDDERINPDKLSIDRIDSSRGYTEDNVQLVCCWVNLMKLDMSMDTFMNRVKTIATYQASS